MLRTLTVVALASAVALGGCVSNNPNASHTAEGAVSGGLIGAAIGAIARPHHAGAGALIGAGIGMITGAAIGASVDQREAWWRHHMRDHAVIIHRDHDRIVLDMRGDALFEPGTANLTPRADRTLHHIAAMLRHHPNKAITVNGYADNRQLSEQRAQAVAEALEHYGVDAGRIHAEGMAMRDDNGAAERHVEIVLEPEQG